ncbi:hypothetical protein ACN4EK_00310 [Pantanalinema rosaneae CENA516]|uniref:hypothetical protein n=1 Tax=Pantanalinema rosaneae TaxID=1620701 RepID=UPI003D6F94F0
MVLQSVRRTIIISSLTISTAAAVMMGLLGNVRPASAGEAGAAGSAAFTIDATSGKVTGAAISAAVGKNGAVAASYNSGSTNAAYSMGSGGNLSVGLASGVVTSIQDTADAAPGTAQANNLDPDAVKTNAPNGTVDIAGSL